MSKLLDHIANIIKNSGKIKRTKKPEKKCISFKISKNNKTNNKSNKTTTNYKNNNMNKF